MSATFDLPILQAVSDWQRGGDAKQNRRRGDALKAACQSLPAQYRASQLCCFRQIALPKGGVRNLVGDDKLTEKISSWTTNIEIAKGFKGGVPPDGQGYQGVILCVYPKPGNIIVNLSNLYREPSFTEALQQAKHDVVGYHDGAGRFDNTQDEIVLEIASVTQEDIYSLGGHSSPFEELIDMAATEIYGQHATPQQRAELLLKAENVRSEAGASWLNPEATKRVLNRLKKPAEQLREIKRLQASD